MEYKEINPQFDDLSDSSVFKDHVLSIAGENSKGSKSTQELLDSLEVLASEKLMPPQAAWKEAGEGGAILGTLGNFSVFIGKAKSRKSFFMNIAVSTLLDRNPVFDHYEGVLPDDQTMGLYFDTEQGKYHVQLALKRICKQIGNPEPKNLKVYGLRTQSPSERLKLIEFAIANTPNLGFVIIDGIKDLISSINDDAEATMIAGCLLRWSQEKNIHIMTVLHQNKSDNNARGHIGTELVNKAETVLSVTKSDRNKEVSIVEAQQCRNKEPEPFAFEILDDMPVNVDDFQVSSKSRQQNADLSSIEDHRKHKVLLKVFEDKSSYSYNDLLKQLQQACKQVLDIKIGRNKAVNFTTLCKEKKWLLQEKEKQPYTLGEFKNDNVSS